MITHERLKELIEQEATIWAVYDEDRIERIKLVVKMFGVSVDEYNKLHDCEPMLYSQFCGVFRDICPISWLFETEEEAEWHKEFGCIERTERLELPIWEEVVYFFKVSPIQNFEITFISDSLLYEFAIYDFDIVRIYMKGFTDTSWDIIFEEPLTKENYLLACKKAKELFLGLDLVY